MKKIVIGHGSYSGSNALRICRSKSAAVDELRFRGVSRSAARAAICEAASGNHVICKSDQGQIEVTFRQDA